MTDRSITKVGGACSMLAGCIFALSGLIFLRSQVGRFDWNSIASISEYLAQVPSAATLWLLVNWGAAVASMLAIAGVLALAEIMQEADQGMVRWLSTLAIIGYAVIAITNVADFYQIHRLAEGYSLLDRSAREAVNLVGFDSLDPLLNIRFMMLSPWFLAVGWHALREKHLPRSIGLLGIVFGIIGLSVVMATLAGMDAVVLLAGAAAVVAHPVWLLATGYQLLLLSRSVSIGMNAAES